eukprot:Opistho-1_new@73787
MSASRRPRRPTPVPMASAMISHRTPSRGRLPSASATRSRRSRCRLHSRLRSRLRSRLVTASWLTSSVLCVSCALARTRPPASSRACGRKCVSTPTCWPRPMWSVPRRWMRSSAGSQRGWMPASAPKSRHSALHSAQGWTHALRQPWLGWRCSSRCMHWCVRGANLSWRTTPPRLLHCSASSPISPLARSQSSDCARLLMAPCVHSPVRQPRRCCVRLKCSRLRVKRSRIAAERRPLVPVRTTPIVCGSNLAPPRVQRPTTATTHPPQVSTARPIGRGGQATPLHNLLVVPPRDCVHHTTSCMCSPLLASSLCISRRMSNLLA